MSHSTNQTDFTIPCSRIAKQGCVACAFLMLSASMMPDALYADVQSNDNVKNGPSNQELTATKTAEPSSNLQPVNTQCPATDPKCPPDSMPESESDVMLQCPATDPKCKRNLSPPSEE